jgi:SAM-dependent methyltransferase
MDKGAADIITVAAARWRPGDRMVTEAEVALAYRYLLGREPESEAAVRAHLDCESIEDLRLRFLRCAEFRDRHVQLGQPPPRPTPRVPLDVEPMVVETDPTPEELQAMVARTEAVWRRLGQSEPHWSVLSTDKYRSERISDNEQAFYDSGEYDAGLVRGALRRCGGRLERIETCLEYGCGVGRATWKLAPLFPRLIACDISETHLELARRRLTSLGNTNVEFKKIDSAARPLEGLRFDLFFSRLVLQHNPPPVIGSVLRDALAGLRPGGFALFQVPTYARGYSFRVREYLAGADLGIEMHCLPQPAVFHLAQAAGCEVLEVREDTDTARSDIFVSNTFVLRRP